MLPIYIDTTTLVTWDKMRDEQTEEYENSATVSAVLLDEDEVQVSGSAITLSYVASSNGRYQGNFPAGLSLTLGAMYLAKLTAVSGSVECVRMVECRAQYAGAQ